MLNKLNQTMFFTEISNHLPAKFSESSFFHEILRIIVNIHQRSPTSVSRCNRGEREPRRVEGQWKKKRNGGKNEEVDRWKKRAVISRDFYRGAESNLRKFPESLRA